MTWAGITSLQFNIDLPGKY